MDISQRTFRSVPFFFPSSRMFMNFSSRIVRLFFLFAILRRKIEHFLSSFFSLSGRFFWLIISFRRAWSIVNIPSAYCAALRRHKNKIINLNKSGTFGINNYQAKQILTRLICDKHKSFFSTPIVVLIFCRPDHHSSLFALIWLQSEKSGDNRIQHQLDRRGRVGVKLTEFQRGRRAMIFKFFFCFLKAITFVPINYQFILSPSPGVRVPAQHNTISTLVTKKALGMSAAVL